MHSGPAHIFRNTFHLKLLENNLRALDMATQACDIPFARRSVGSILCTPSQSFLRINEAGMLSIAHKIVTEGGGQLFVSFTFQPDEAIGDEEEGSVGGEAPSRAAHTERAGRDVPVGADPGLHHDDRDGSLSSSVR